MSYIGRVVSFFADFPEICGLGASAMGTHKRLSHPVLLVFVVCWTFPLSVSSARAQEAAQEAEPQEPGFAALVGQLTAHLKRVDPQTETLPRTATIL